MKGLSLYRLSHGQITSPKFRERLAQCDSSQVSLNSALSQPILPNVQGRFSVFCLRLFFRTLTRKSTHKHTGKPNLYINNQKSIQRITRRNNNFVQL